MVVKFYSINRCAIVGITRLRYHQQHMFNDELLCEHSLVIEKSRSRSCWWQNTSKMRKNSFRCLFFIFGIEKRAIKT